MQTEDEPEAVADARRMGLPDDAIAAIRAQLAPPQLEGDGVWPEHAAIVEAFLSVATQWRTASIGGGLAPGRLLFVGLDYAGAHAGIEAAGIAITPELWAGVRVMEEAARSALNDLRT